jgi:hypothetical protein
LYRVYKEESMSYWILQFNPNDYRRDPTGLYEVDKDDWWGISFYLNKIKSGDLAFIWQSIDYRDPAAPKSRGIYAEATIVSVPPHKPSVEARIKKLKSLDKAWLDPQKEQHQKAKKSILLRYVASYADNPLTKPDLESAGLEKIHILCCSRPDISKLSQLEATKIKALLKVRLRKQSTNIPR